MSRIPRERELPQNMRQTVWTLESAEMGWRVTSLPTAVRPQKQERPLSCPAIGQRGEHGPHEVITAPARTNDRRPPANTWLAGLPSSGSSKARLCRLGLLDFLDNPTGKLEDLGQPISSAKFFSATRILILSPSVPHFFSSSQKGWFPLQRRGSRSPFSPLSRLPTGKNFPSRVG